MENATPYDLWKVEIRNRRGILTSATFQFETTALHYCIDYLAYVARHRKHASCFVTGPNTRHEYHG